jgi:hypothetical protein
MGLSLLKIHAEGFGKGAVRVTASRRIEKIKCRFECFGAVLNDDERGGRGGDEN